MKYTESQNRVLKKFDEFLKSDSNIFILKGYAGTGKTTLLKAFIDSCKKDDKEVQLMAPTGRAAKILADKTGRMATTIHKAIYKLSRIETENGDEDTDSDVSYYFPLKTNEGDISSCVCIVDESSMINSRKTGGDIFRFGRADLLDDLLDYFNPEKGGKLVFVGDPAQLPPVGENSSKALSHDFFESKGLCVIEEALTEVIRQEKDSPIQNNSFKIRDLLTQKQRNTLQFEYETGKCESVESSDVVNEFLNCFDADNPDSAIVICYSNAQARLYNEFIRRSLYKVIDSPIRIGDRLLIIGNNYSNPERSIMNGEFAKVMSVSEKTEKQSARIFRKENGVTSSRLVSLLFRDVTLQFYDGSIIEQKIIDSLLNNDNRDLSHDEICALYINFQMRHRNLNLSDKEYKDLLMTDPYLNALRVKYGYAITGHKSQGGEWETVFVDYRNRTGLNDDSLRWSYTATTRASQKLYTVNAPYLTPYDKFRIDKIDRMSKIPEGAIAYSGVPEDGYHKKDASEYLKVKCLNVIRNLAGSEFSILEIASFNYRERYLIQDNNGHRYSADIMYNKSGIFKPFSLASKDEDSERLLELLNKPDEYFIECAYHPSNEVLQHLYVAITSACDDNDFRISNVCEHLDNYKVVYFLESHGQYRYIDFYIDKNSAVTYAKPHSQLGENDTDFRNLLTTLKLQ